jgi:hypothetical protein
MILLFDTSTAGALSSVIFHKRAMDRFFKDGLIINFKLSLEVGEVIGIGRTIGTTTSLSKSVAIIMGFITRMTPFKDVC